MHKIDTFTTYADAPDWWKRFVNNDFIYKSITRKEFIVRITTVLSEYNATVSTPGMEINNDRVPWYIEFETEEDFLAFILKWT